MPSSWMWRHVGLERADVSEEADCPCDSYKAYRTPHARRRHSAAEYPLLHVRLVRKWRQDAPCCDGSSGRVRADPKGRRYGKRGGRGDGRGGKNCELSCQPACILSLMFISVYTSLCRQVPASSELHGPMYSAVSAVRLAVLVLLHCMGCWIGRAGTVSLYRLWVWPCWYCSAVSAVGLAVLVL
jgi:hypothetical protein